MDTPVLADQQKHPFISSVWIVGAVWRTYQVQWLIETYSKRDSRESVLLARHYDDDDDDDDIEDHSQNSIVTHMYNYFTNHFSRCVSVAEWLDCDIVLKRVRIPVALLVYIRTNAF